MCICGMQLLLLLQEDPISCYSTQAVLSGYRQNKKYELTVIPLDNTFCNVYDQMSSTMYLQYYDTASSTTKEISAQYTHRKAGSFAVSFDLSSDTALYSLIEGQSRLAFRAQLSGQFEQHIQAISDIKHIQMDATECWEDVVLVVQPMQGKQFIEVSGKPLDCKINNPDAMIQFQQDNVWRNIHVYGQAVPGQEGKFFVSTQSFDSSNYNFNTITNYRQTMAQLQALYESAPAPQKAVYKQDIENLEELLGLLEEDKYTKTRLYLQVQLTNGQFQDVIGDATGMARSDFRGCVNGADLQHFVMLQPERISMGINKTRYLTTPSCVRGTFYHLQLSYRLLYDNGQVIEQTTPFSVMPVEQFATLPSFSFDIAPVDLNHVKLASYNAFYRVYYNEIMLIEEAFHGEMTLSCFQLVQTIFHNGGVCIGGSFTAAERCKFSGLKTLVVTVFDQGKSQVLYEYQMDANYSGRVIFQCTDEKTAMQAVNPGYRQFRDYYRKNSGGDLFIQVATNEDIAFSQYGSFNYSLAELVPFMAVGLAAVLVVALAVAGLVKHNLK